MAKLKPARAKGKSSAAPKGGIPCLIALVSGLLLVMLLLYMVMKNANG